MGHKISKEQIDPGVKDHIMSFVGDINELETNEKSNIIDAVNSLVVDRVDNAENMGKLANAIGEPVTANHSVDEVVEGLGEMLSTFKTNMMNNGITVESSDKFKALIDKVKTMVENGQGKGIQFAEGSLSKTHSAYGTSQGSPVTTTVDYDPGFVPTILLVKISVVVGTDMPIQWYTPNVWCSNTVSSANIHIRNTSQKCAVKITDLAITDDKSFIVSWTPYVGTTQMQFLEYIAIGVGEEDTTLLDSLKSILAEEGVTTTEEDDMASLISKVDTEFNDKNNEMSSLNTNITLLTNQVNSLTSELAGKVTPAGTAVAGDVLSGKTFINSTGQVVTGSIVNRGGAQTVTPGTSNKTLNAGYYSGNITIEGDADLVAANIVSGKNIFGVAGTAKKAPTATPGTEYTFMGPSDYSTSSPHNSLQKVYTTYRAIPVSGTYTCKFNLSCGGYYDSTIRCQIRTTTGAVLLNVSTAPSYAGTFSQHISLTEGDVLEVWLQAESYNSFVSVGSLTISCTLNW